MWSTFPCEWCRTNTHFDTELQSNLEIFYIIVDLGMIKKTIILIAQKH